MTKSSAYRKDNNAAKAHVYGCDGKGPNPYEEGTRPARLWDKWREFYMNGESRMDEMAAAYGEFRPDRLEAS
ncbi:hypothetical protein [Octadecabacter antarcticus]|nr:hypothetical protein [Octadecabacter antarcticus]